VAATREEVGEGEGEEERRAETSSASDA
jgi:hypothetical protein